MKPTFDGLYYKHQKGDDIVSLIIGISAGDHAFIQVITNSDSYYFKYPISDYSGGERIKIGDSLFSKDGIKVSIKEKDISITGDIKYTSLTPIKYDIMGPFKYLPLQCKHRVISLHHKLTGHLAINDEIIDFSDGIGYIEGDFGHSFPKSYAWMQCNSFPEKACIMVSVADIPFAGFHFQGCIGVVYMYGIEYRLATYLGVKIICCNENQIILQQGRLRLEIEIDSGMGHKLMAPAEGKMVREIQERIVCGAKFRFTSIGQTLFEEYSPHASFEFVSY